VGELCTDLEETLADVDDCIKEKQTKVSVLSSYVVSQLYCNRTVFFYIISNCSSLCYI